MKQLSKEELLGRWEDVRAIRNVMGRISADYVLKKEGQMFQNYWSAREDVCLGVNEGYYVGRDAVANYYGDQAKLISAESEAIQRAFPEELGEKSPDEVYGVGMIDYKPVDTYVIEEAGDGQTAKGIWMIRGAHSQITKGGPVAYWEWGWFAVDFILENDDWKVWHMQYLQEIDRVSGAKWTGPQKEYKERPEFADYEPVKIAPPNHPCKIHEVYHAHRPFSRSPRLPEPYETFNETFSYGV